MPFKSLRHRALMNAYESDELMNPYESVWARSGAADPAVFCRPRSRLQIRLAGSRAVIPAAR